jgi:hypothetical protein
VNPDTKPVLAAAEEVVTRLLDVCRKNVPLDRQSPRTVVQVNRTSRCLLNALSRLNHEMSTASGRSAA